MDTCIVLHGESRTSAFLSFFDKFLLKRFKLLWFNELQGYRCFRLFWDELAFSLLELSGIPLQYVKTIWDSVTNCNNIYIYCLQYFLLLSNKMPTFDVGNETKDNRYKAHFHRPKV